LSSHFWNATFYFSFPSVSRIFDFRRSTWTFPYLLRFSINDVLLLGKRRWVVVAINGKKWKKILIMKEYCNSIRTWPSGDLYCKRINRTCTLLHASHYVHVQHRKSRCTRTNKALLLALSCNTRFKINYWKTYLTPVSCFHLNWPKSAKSARKE